MASVRFDQAKRERVFTVASPSLYRRPIPYPTKMPTWIRTIVNFPYDRHALFTYSWQTAYNGPDMLVHAFLSSRRRLTTTKMVHRTF